jgi:hypothetical protein
MVNLRKFSISDELFSGFEIMIDLDNLETIDNIIKEVLKNAIDVLEEKKFYNLVRLLKDKANKFHVHDYTFAEILMSQTNDIFYICSHC